MTNCMYAIRVLYGIRPSKKIKIWEYQNTFSADLSSFKYNRNWNDIFFFTNYSDFSFLILPENGAPSSSLASRLALTLVFYFWLKSLPQIWTLASYNYVCGVGNENCMVNHFTLVCIMWNLRSDQNWNENKKNVRAISLICSYLCFLILHYNGL